MLVGQTIRNFRQERGWTLTELASRLNISYSYLSAIERGLKNPSLHTLKRIASALNVPVSYFFSETGEDHMASKLRLIREGRALSVEELGEAAGVAPDKIRDYEEGIERPGLDTLEKLAECLGVTVRYFLEKGSSRTSMGERMRHLREQRGMSLAALAEKANVSPSLLSQVENDKAMPSIDTLEAVAECLNTTICYFLLEQQEVTDLLSTRGPDVLESLNDPRVQSVLRAIRDFSAGELKYILNFIHFFKRYRYLL